MNEKILKESKIIVHDDFLPENELAELNQLVIDEDEKFQRIYWDKDYMDNQAYSNKDAEVYAWEDKLINISPTLDKRIRDYLPEAEKTLDFKFEKNLDLFTTVWKIKKPFIFPPHTDGLREQKPLYGATLLLNVNEVNGNPDSFFVWDYYVDEQNKKLTEFPEEYANITDEPNRMLMFDMSTKHHRMDKEKDSFNYSILIRFFEMAE